MAAETNDTAIRFELEEEGRVTSYELPSILDLDIDEWMVVYEYSSLVLDDFAPLEDPEEEAARMAKLRHPGFMKALCHVAYARAHPKKTKAAVKELIGSAKLMTLLESMAGGEEAADDPTLTTALERSSSSGSDESNGSSPPASETSSGTPDDQPAITGTGV